MRRWDEMSDKKGNEGVPADAEITSPYVEVHDTDKGAEKEEQPKSLLPIFIFISLFLMVVFGGVLTVLQYVGGADEETNISLEKEQKVPEVELFDEKTPPPLTTIAANTVNNLDEYEINESSEEKKMSETQFNDLMDRLDDIERQIANAVDAIEESQVVLNKTNSNTNTIAEKANAIISSTEIIASKLNRQFSQVELVKNLMTTETERSKSKDSKIPFRVAAKSIWGDVVYLTVATDDNFEQQTGVGGMIAGWTLKSVDLMNKRSVWHNLNGDSHVLNLP